MTTAEASMASVAHHHTCFEGGNASANLARAAQMWRQLKLPTVKSALVAHRECQIAERRKGLEKEPFLCGHVVKVQRNIHHHDNTAKNLRHIIGFEMLQMMNRQTHSIG